MKEYIIAGDSALYKECLVYICGTDKEFAERVLNKMLTNPDENDLMYMKEYTNLKVKEIDDKDCWWNGGTD